MLAPEPPHSLTPLKVTQSPPPQPPLPLAVLLPTSLPDVYCDEGVFGLGALAAPAACIAAAEAWATALPPCACARAVPGTATNAINGTEKR